MLLSTVCCKSFLANMSVTFVGIKLCTDMLIAIILFLFFAKDVAEEFYCCFDLCLNTFTLLFHHEAL